MNLPDEPVTNLFERLTKVAVDDVALRRLRRRVLGDAHTANAAAPHAPEQLRRFLPLPSIVLAVLVAVWSPRQPPEDATFAAFVRSSDGSPIRWSRRIEAGTEWIDLQEGRFRLELHTRSAVGPVSVRVPDGHIEDLGTVFDVWVEEGRTTHVRVTTGRVALWLGGARGSILTPGDAWEAPPVLREPPPAAAATAPVSAPRALHRRNLDEVSGHREGAEDAAYLKVIRLLRASQTSEARTAARDYLARFPDGFRVEEMERLAKP